MMNNFPILTNSLLITAVLDSEYISQLFSEKDRTATSILKYNKIEGLTIFRTDFPTKFEDINKIPCLSIAPPNEGQLKFFINLFRKTVYPTSLQTSK